MTIDLDTLEAAAKAATPGPWDIDPRNCDIVTRYADGGDVAETQRISNAGNDAYYIASVSPDVVLELIAELRAEREKYINAVKVYKAAVQEAAWLAFQVHKQRRRCPPLQECDSDDIVTENDCQQCWLNAAREAVEGKR